MKSFVLEFFIAARFANLAVSLPQYQFASHMNELRGTRNGIKRTAPHGLPPPSRALCRRVGDFEP
jgi:hypothetical protein